MKKFIILLLLIHPLSQASQRYEIGDCAIKNGSTSPNEIFKIISIKKEKYSVYTYFISNGKLILAEDYKIVTKKEVEFKYSKVLCPSHDGEFSPDKYLNKKNM